MDIEETKKLIFERSGGLCEVCGKILKNMQIAHRINQNKMYLKKYGVEVIHHHFNLVGTCSLFCNSSVSIYGKTKLIEKLVKKIQKELDKEYINSV